MKNIVLFCAAGMSTSLLVSKMRAAAQAKGFECEINAHGLSEARQYGPDADIILLGPQVSYKLKETQALFPDKIVETIDMMDYGMMNGEKVMTHVIEVLGK